MSDQFIQTYTGKRFNPCCIVPERDIAIEDIAHALALTNRFTGHTPRPYSVAQHSVLVSSLCPPPFKLWGLLHDAPEAYFADISRPVKMYLNSICDGAIKTMEDYIAKAVCDRFHLCYDEPANVKEADNIALANEAYSFFGETELYKSWHHRFENGYRNLGYRISPMSWELAEERFLECFDELYSHGEVV